MQELNLTQKDIDAIQNLSTLEEVKCTLEFPKGVVGYYRGCEVHLEAFYKQSAGE